MRAIRILPLLLLPAFVFLSCGSNDTFSSVNFGPADILWKLRTFQLRDGTTVAVPDPDRYTLYFNRNGFIDITADCNTCTGEYVYSAGLFRIIVQECTTAACPEGSLGPSFIAATNTVTGFGMEGDVLTLTYPGGTMILRP